MTHPILFCEVHLPDIDICISSSQQAFTSCFVSSYRNGTRYTTRLTLHAACFITISLNLSSLSFRNRSQVLYVFGYVSNPQMMCQDKYINSSIQPKSLPPLMQVHQGSTHCILWWRGSHGVLLKIRKLLTFSGIQALLPETCPLHWRNAHSANRKFK